MTDAKGKPDAGLELEQITCVVCGSAESAPLFTSRDLRYDFTPRDEFTLVECARCGLRYVNPRPTERSLDLFYPDTYYRDRKEPPRVRRAPPSGLRRLYPPRAERVLQEKVRHARALAPAGGRVLEIGPAAGQCLEAMREAGYDVVGLERNPKMVEHIRNTLEIPCWRPDEFDPAGAGRVDLVVLWNVFEHLSDPVGMLTQARSFLRPGGGLVFSVPNAAALEREVFFRGESCEDVPRHLFSYSPQTVRALLEKEGFTVERVVSVTRTAVSELQERTERALFRSPLGRPLKKVVYNFGVLPLIWAWDRGTGALGRGHTLVVSARLR
ncbi:MAG: class I SAM-dependent methyltransferase [Candidatus Eisenbacteria bacterium]|uniref:Class I SAM-dependent methyltransferase n=1 Tax=Eiseniibacteriota bacterium TaxID=2212470 RepID=A0A956LY24_UNCEI|nr:class I SAM-dependent methyltransferase [Candidatus Eisenbacteria bacterium]